MRISFLRCRWFYAYAAGCVLVALALAWWLLMPTVNAWRFRAAVERGDEKAVEAMLSEKGRKDFAEFHRRVGNPLSDLIPESMDPTPSQIFNGQRFLSLAGGHKFEPGWFNIEIRPWGIATTDWCVGHVDLELDGD